MLYAGLRDEGAQLERAQSVREVSLLTLLPCTRPVQRERHNTRARELITRKRHRAHAPPGEGSRISTIYYLTHPNSLTPSIMELGSHLAAKLEPFVLMSKSAKGAAAAKLILDAISAQGVYFFAELLDAPNIKEVRFESWIRFITT